MNREMNEIKIWPADESVSLTCCGDGNGDIAVLILPGGGYNMCAPPEGMPVAERFADMGYCAYVLRYSTRFGSPENMGGEVNLHTLFPEPLREVAAAVTYIRKTKGNIPLVIIGFSAGGHLAACYSSLWDKPEIGEGIADRAEELRPDVCVLGYAATELSQDEIIMKAIYGDKDHYSEEELHRYMASELIGAQTPPTFLFHSITDPMVPVRESIEYSQALAASGIAHEVHLFGCGGHAYALGRGEPMGKWVELADAFIRQLRARPLDYDKAEVRCRSEERRRNFKPNKH
ncbi:MAG: alpha/beta hydrolase [Oscillospiraceae bacterium]|nr:alpha/beta hydrolase [Oscillospiraceae bacterium]